MLSRFFITLFLAFNIVQSLPAQNVDLYIPDELEWVWPDLPGTQARGFKTRAGIITAAHFVGPSGTFVYYEKDNLVGRVSVSDNCLDLALIEARTKSKDKLRMGQNVAVDEKVYLDGKELSVVASSLWGFSTLKDKDNSIVAGYSGSGVLDSSGNLVGIFIEESSDHKHLCFANSTAIRMLLRAFQNTR